MMNQVIDILKIRNRNEVAFTKADILRIYSILIQCYKIHTVTDVSFDESYKYFMNYCVDTREIKINCSKIIVGNNAAEYNYSVLFAILHELEHALQVEYIENNNDALSLAYSKCFDMLKSENLTSNTYYSLFHNFFPIEFNADVKAYINLIKVLNSLGDKEAEEMYTNLLYTRMEEYKLEDFQKLLEVIYGDDLPGILREVDSSEARLNGLIKHI